MGVRQERQVKPIAFDPSLSTSSSAPPVSPLSILAHVRRSLRTQLMVGVVRWEVERRGWWEGGGADVTQLPLEVLSRVFRFLDARSLALAATVSREWRVHADDDWLWERHVTFTFLRGGEEGGGGKEGVSWRERFHQLQAGAVDQRAPLLYFPTITSCVGWGVANPQRLLNCDVCVILVWSYRGASPHILSGQQRTTTFYRFIVLSFYRFIVASLHRCIVASLHRCIVASSHDWNSMVSPQRLEVPFFSCWEEGVYSRPSSCSCAVQPRRVWRSNRAWCQVCRKLIWAPASVSESNPLPALECGGMCGHGNGHLPYDAETVRTPFHTCEPLFALVQNLLFRIWIEQLAS